MVYSFLFPQETLLFLTCSITYLDVQHDFCCHANCSSLQRRKANYGMLHTLYSVHVLKGNKNTTL
jgi:hypothetical protein